jgi:integrase
MATLGMKGARKTFSELAEEHLLHPETKTNPALIRWWVNQQGDQKLADITTKDIKRVLNVYAIGKAMRGGITKDGKPKTTTINRTRAPATVNRMKAALSAVYKFVVKQRTRPR